MNDKEARVRLVDHTAEVGLRVEAPTPADAFAAAAEAMFDVMIVRASLSGTKCWSVSAEAEGWDDLLVAWLEELLYHFEVQGRAAKSCRVTEMDPTRVTGEIVGDLLDRSRHEVGTEIKAVTYHKLLARPTADGFEIEVLFDI